MPVPNYSTISILAFSPLAGVRRASGTTMTTISEVDERGARFKADSDQLAQLTKQEDPKLRLAFAFRAMDRAPSAHLRDLVPLEMMILHYARTLPAWPILGHAPSLNIITLDWPDGEGYEVRAYLVGTKEPMSPEQLPFFYEQQRESVQPAVAAKMPPVRV
ncbi:hypothetical protein [Pseudomonas violetae]|uniref:Uncharacterized protein n=1 Tax=Pseudomonas violetae TaxID=2915813 RepID=A0ABT0EST8_9PSED|nr:hypothetical protein [Pseudomonas violetae]MCK1788807.1 hypothetical protein [Pseudomonas violetae]